MIDQHSTLPLLMIDCTNDLTDFVLLFLALCFLVLPGEACEYMSCPGTTSPCNGHGQCLDMTTLATLSTVNGDLAYYTYGAIPNNPLTWDAEKVDKRRFDSDLFYSKSSDTINQKFTSVFLCSTIHLVS